MLFTKTKEERWNEKEKDKKWTSNFNQICLDSAVLLHVTVNVANLKLCKDNADILFEVIFCARIPDDQLVFMPFLN